jgi:hypothetical protein
VYKMSLTEMALETATARSEAKTAIECLETEWAIADDLAHAAQVFLDSDAPEAEDELRRALACHARSRGA